MIKLTEVLLDGQRNVKMQNPVYVPTEVVVKPWHEFTSVIVPNGGQYIVTESPEEVVRKIVDYKLAMVRYESTHPWLISDGLATLCDLAGIGADSK
ncbi:hypothetical protein [Cohnella sp. 56]|uniref:hypothetical protein n=1 Tax=Cohnella sp. 56 TaxID=3113722 RepID=UPI0030E8ED66